VTGEYSDIGTQFWRELEDPKERARLAYQWVSGLEGELRRTQAASDRQAVQLYEGDDGNRIASEDGQTVTNTIQSAVDSFVSDIVRQRVKLQFLTERGNWEERRQAEQMNRAIEGLSDEAGFYGDEGVAICRDGCVRPAGGAVKLTPDYESVRCLVERIRACRLFVDARDARFGRPRSLVYVEDYAPEVLAARYPKHADQLLRSENVAYEDFGESELRRFGGLLPRRTKIWEVWHLPSKDVDSSKDEEWGLDGAKPSHDGRHLVLAGPCDGEPITLEDEPWAFNYFPIAVFRPHTRMDQWAGHSFTERLMRAQKQIDKYQTRIDGMLNLYARVMLFVNRNKGVEVSKLSNDWTRVIEGDGTFAECMAQIVPGTVPPDLIGRVNDLIQWTRDFSGKTELTMMGQKPAGTESGVALRTLLDQESVRHSDIYRAWEQFHVNIGRIAIGMFRLLAARNSKFEVSWGDDQELRRVKWKDIDLDNMKWKLRAWPVSLFSSTPSAKLEQLTELFEVSGIDKAKVVPVLASQFPDIAALFGDENAMLSNIERKLARIIEDRELRDENLPHGFMDLEMAEKVAVARINACEVDGAPDEVILALGQFVEAVKAKQKEVEPPTPPPPPTPMGATPGPSINPALPPPGPSPLPPPGAPGVPPLPSG